MDRGAWGAAAHRAAQNRTRLKWLCMHACIGEGNGNPLQYSCLENPRDRGAWWAAIYGVAQSRTRLKQLSSSSSIECAPQSYLALGVRETGYCYPLEFDIGWRLLLGITVPHLCPAIQVAKWPLVDFALMQRNARASYWKSSCWVLKWHVPSGMGGPPDYGWLVGIWEYQWGRNGDHKIFRSLFWAHQ